MAAVTTGDALTGLRPAATAESDWVWLGWWPSASSVSDYSAFALQMANAAVTWAGGGYEVLSMMSLPSPHMRRSPGSESASPRPKAGAKLAKYV